MVGDGSRRNALFQSSLGPRGPGVTMHAVHEINHLLFQSSLGPRGPGVE